MKISSFIKIRGEGEARLNTHSFRILPRRCYLALIESFGFVLDLVDDPAEEGEDGDEEGAGQREEEEKKENAAVGAHLDVLPDHVPWGHLNFKNS